MGGADRTYRNCRVQGNGARSALVCVYGNRAYEDTLVEMQNAATDAGFQVIAAVAAIAQHSIMPQYASGRPDARDREQLAELSSTIAERAKGLAEGIYKRNRFLVVRGAEREVNWDLVESARLRAGVKGYVTSLSRAEATPVEVVDAHHRLFQVERSFRMSKTDLRARPIYHRKRESIEAHLTVVLAALAVSRAVQRLTGLSIRRFRHALEPLRTCVISVNGTGLEVPPALTDQARSILDAIGMESGRTN